MKKNNQVTKVECELCGKPAARLVFTAKVFGRGAKRVLIENIPTYYCQNCHSQYVAGATLDEIDKIRKNPAAVSHQATIATVRLAA